MESVLAKDARVGFVEPEGYTISRGLLERL
jgi:hypothetical protein